MNLFLDLIIVVREVQSTPLACLEAFILGCPKRFSNDVIAAYIQSTGNVLWEEIQCI